MDIQQSLLRLFVLLLSACCVCQTVSAFVSGSRDPVLSIPTLRMVGGRGWDNGDYLGGLSGDDEDRQKAQETYEEFSERRQAFQERQNEILKTPQGQSFLKQQQQRQQQNPQVNPLFGDDGEDEWTDVSPGSGGGSRMAQMMAQAKRRQNLKSREGAGGMIGFEQRFAVPLDEDEEESKEETE